MAYAFFLGVDIAERESDAGDEITLALLEKEKNSGDDEAQYRLDRIRHDGENLSAESLADRIQSLAAERPYIGRTSIIVNREPSLGGVLLDALSDRGLDPVAASLTGGTGTTSGARGETGVHLGIVDAVQALVGLYETGRFTIEEHGTEAASRLAREVQHAFEVLDEIEGDQASGTAADRFPRFEEGDTYLSSAALAAWLGRERSFDPSQHLKEDPQTGRP